MRILGVQIGRGGSNIALKRIMRSRWGLIFEANSEQQTLVLFSRILRDSLDEATQYKPPIYKTRLLTIGGMTGLELPAFIVGLSGLIAVFEKSFVIWRTVRAAHGFGDDVANILSMLEMEFFRFQTWWTALQHLALARKPSRTTTSTTANLQNSLQKTICQPVVSAAENVLRCLEEVEVILRETGVLNVMADQKDANLQTTISVTDLRHRQIDFASELSKKTPWHKRLLHNANLWRESDKKRLESKLENIVYWNDSLYSILPQNLRDSILEIGIAGYVLPIPGDVQSTSKTSRLNQSAILRENRRLMSQQLPNDDLQKKLDGMKKQLSDFSGLSAVITSQAKRYTIMDYIPSAINSQDNECRSMIEWYPYPKKESIDIARKRIAQIAYLLQAGQGAVNLSTLDAVGYLEEFKCFGLVLRLPVGTPVSIQPTTLHDLLARKLSADYNSLPTLANRFDLAATIASSFYSFMLARWHHERFSSSKIVFLLKKPSKNSERSAPDISKPVIGGFDISRPDSSTEVSIQAHTPLDEADLFYLHPVLRNAMKADKGARATASETVPLPKYQRVFDVYSFGIFLAEVGFWNTISKVAQGARGVGSKRDLQSLSPDDFKEAVIRKCQDDLGCWMGETYRDITIACLKTEYSITTSSDQHDAQELNNFYWEVVVRLLQFNIEAL